jgi:hypothetical protein
LVDRAIEGTLWSFSQSADKLALILVAIGGVIVDLAMVNAVI